MPIPALHLHDLVVTRGGQALSPPLTIDLPAGALVALVGPSGCGKSSLLATLAGSLPAPVGTVVRSVPAAPGSVGLVHQDHHLVPRASLLDNVCCGDLHRLPAWRTILGFPPDTRRRARALLEDLGLGHLERRWATDVSGGERARTALARVLLQAPSLLLADEPVASLDAATAARAMGLLAARAAAGALVICALHQPELVARHATHVLDAGDGWTLRSCR